MIKSVSCGSVVVLLVVGWVGLFAVWGCRFPDRADVVREFMPGVYERMIDDSVGQGSIVLRVVHQNGDAYSIERYSVMAKVQDGVVMPEARDTQVWTGIYDAKHRVLYEQRKGKVLLFVPEERRLLIGGSAYLKVK